MSSPHLAIAVLSDPSRRESLIKFMSKSGVQVGIHYKVPCHSQACIDKSRLKIDFRSEEQASSIASKIISLPMSECHTTSDIQYVAILICEFFDRN